MEDKLFQKLDELDISNTSLLLDEDINLLLASSSRKRIEESIMKKTGYYNETNKFSNKMNNILGGILMKKKIALALGAAIVLSLGGGGYAYAKTPVAYVSLDINPSVELGVNAFDTVVSAEAYNDDGEKVLEDTNLVNSNVNDAVSTVITNAISDGYIKEDDTITNDASVTTSAAVEITVSTDKENVADKLEESLKEVADKALEDNDLDATVETDKVALARRDEARQLGITPGKLNLIQKLQALDPTIKVEDYKASSVKDIQKKAKELRKNNKNSELTADNNTNTENNNTNADATSETNTQNGEAAVSESSIDSDKNEAIAPEKNNNASDEKRNNGSIKKEENSNSKKEENGNANIDAEENNSKKEEKTSNISEKKNNSDQGNDNSSKSEKSSSSNSKSQSKGNNKEKNN